MSTRSLPTTSQRALIDAVVDSYVSWREANVAAGDALVAWRSSERSHRPSAFDRYREALDREERAATAYQHLIELARAA